MNNFLIGLLIVIIVVPLIFWLENKTKTQNIIDCLCKFKKYGDATYTISDRSYYESPECRVEISYYDQQGESVSVIEKYQLSAIYLATTLADALRGNSYVLSGGNGKYKVCKDNSASGVHTDSLDRQVSHYVNMLLEAKEKVRNNEHNTDGSNIGYIRLSSQDFMNYCNLLSYDSFTSVYQTEGTVTYEMSMSKLGIDFLTRFHKACSEHHVTVAPYFYLQDFDTKKYTYAPVESNKAKIQRKCTSYHRGFYSEGIEFRG